MSHHYQSSNLQTFDCRPQRPVHYSLWRTLNRGFHWKCLITTVLLHCCISYAAWCHFQHYAYGSDESSSMFTRANGPCSQGYSFIPVALGFLLYLVYLSECWSYRTKMMLLPRRSVAEVREMVRGLRHAIPIVWWKSLSYHYMRRTRYVTRYRNGDAVRATQVYYERVNSHSAGNVFLYDSCGYRDISRELCDLERHSLVRMRLSKGFVFANMQSANEFEQQRTRFFSDNEMRDDYMEVREGLDLADAPFVEHLLVVSTPSAKCKGRWRWNGGGGNGVGGCDVRRRGRSERITTNMSDSEGQEGVDSSGGEREETDALRTESNSRRRPAATTGSSTRAREPWYLCPVVYWVASVFLLSWPLRMWTEWRTAHIHYQITKLFGSNYLSPSSPHYTGLLTRSSTMEAVEQLEAATRNNYLIVPSYSEAILLDPVTGVAPPPSHWRNDALLESPSLHRHAVTNEGSRIIANSNTAITGGGGGCHHAHYGTIEDGDDVVEQEEAARVRSVAGTLLANLSPWRRRGGAGTRGIVNGYQQLTPVRVVDCNWRVATGRGKQYRTPRSQSMSFVGRAGVIGVTMPSQPARHIPPQRAAASIHSTMVGRNKAPVRSISISAEMAARLIGRNGTTPTTNTQQPIISDAEVYERPTTTTTYSSTSDRQPLLEQYASARSRGNFAYMNEPPPPYEVALRICAPIYQRIRQSSLVNSVSSLLNLSRSSSRELRQYTASGLRAEDVETNETNEDCSSSFATAN